MKILGIMQPYFMPYIGYWQLMNLVDEYVIFDDVNYINRGWINRNRIYYSGAVRYINIPILAVSQNKKINELEMSDDRECYQRILDIIRMAYKKAPYYDSAIQIMEESIMYQERNAARYLAHSIEVIANYLEIKTQFLFSSEIRKDNLRVGGGKEKVIDICMRRQADCYVNAIGGMELYHRDEFVQRGIELKFLRPIEEKLRYRQFDGDFHENLSIIDVLMFNDRLKVQDFLMQYELI